MRPDCQLWGFNAKVIGSPTMVLLPCSHSCPPTLVPLYGDDGEGCGGWRTALSSQGTSSPRTWCSSAISPSSFRSSLVIFGCFPPRLGPWAYYSKWVGVPRPFSNFTYNLPNWRIYYDLNRVDNDSKWLKKNTRVNLTLHNLIHQKTNL